MATIDTGSPRFTVMVRLTVDPADQDALTAVAQEMGDVFAAQPGFVSLTLHKSHDGKRLVTYLQWQDRAAHEACQGNPEVMARGARFMEFLQSGRAEIEVETFDVVQVIDG